MFEQKVQYPGHSVSSAIDIVITPGMHAMCTSIHRLRQCVAASLARTVMTIRPLPAEFLHAGRVDCLPGRFEKILEAFLVSRGNPLHDTDLALAGHPESIFGH